jgi:uncharacterized membrane protein YdbT with pleckstrin-like domain
MPAEDRIVHQSLKTVWASYVFAVVVILTGIWAYFEYGQNLPARDASVLLVFLVPPVKLHMSRRLITMRLEGDHLTLESGILSRTRRTVDMAKIQDVTVRQSLGQRILGVGDLMLESAGESGGMAMANVDNPREIADVILASSRRAHGAGIG